MKQPITNIEVTRHGGSRYSLGCEHGGARYHIWIDRNKVYDGETLFKNPPRTVKHGDPGDFRTRHLRLDSKFSKWLINEMMAEAVADQLFDKADATWDAQEAETQRQHEIAVRIRRIHEAGPKLYDALRELVMAAEAPETTIAEWEGAIANARKSLAEAEAN